MPMRSRTASPQSGIPSATRFGLTLTPPSRSACGPKIGVHWPLAHGGPRRVYHFTPLRSPCLGGHPLGRVSQGRTVPFPLAHTKSLVLRSCVRRLAELVALAGVSFEAPAAVLRSGFDASCPACCLSPSSVSERPLGLVFRPRGRIGLSVRSPPTRPCLLAFSGERTISSQGW